MSSPNYEEQAAFVSDLTSQAQRVTTPCGDGDLVWHIWGNGPALVLMHGAHGSWTHWIKNIPALAKHYSVMIPDLPGMGESAMPPEPYLHKIIAKVVSDGIDQLLPASQGVDVAGFSFGGSIAGHFAAHQNKRTGHCILISSSGMGLARNEPQGLRNWRKAETDADRIAINRHNLSVLMFGNADKIDDLAVYIQAENTRQTRFKSRVIKNRFNNLDDAVPNIKARMGSLWGDNDVYSKGHLPARNKFFTDIQPDSQFHVIPGAGHWVIYEEPEESTRIIRKILNDGA